MGSKVRCCPGRRAWQSPRSSTAPRQRPGLRCPTAVQGYLRPRRAAPQSRLLPRQPPPRQTGWLLTLLEHLCRAHGRKFKSYRCHEEQLLAFLHSQERAAWPPENSTQTIWWHAMVGKKHAQQKACPFMPRIRRVTRASLWHRTCVTCACRTASAVATSYHGQKEACHAQQAVGSSSAPPYVLKLPTAAATPARVRVFPARLNFLSTPLTRPRV